MNKQAIISMALISMLMFAMATAGCDATNDSPSKHDDDGSIRFVELRDDPALPTEDGLDESEPWCPRGYATNRGGCIERLTGGSPGHDGTAVALRRDGTNLIVATRGREIVLYILKDREVLGELVLSRMGGDPDIAVDRSGGIHVVFHQLERNSIEYLVYKTVAWKRETVALLDDTQVLGIPGSGPRPSITTSAGSAHISFGDGGRIHHAWRRDDGDWETNAIMEHPSNTSDIAVDPNDRVLVVAGGADGELLFARRQDGNWLVESADASSGIPFLRVDPEGIPLICWVGSYIDEGNEHHALHVSTLDGDAWKSWELESNGFGSNCALWDDAAGNAEILYANFRPEGLSLYESQDGDFGTWALSVVDEDVQDGDGVSYDRWLHGESVAAFHSEGRLLTAIRGGFDWATDVIDDGVGIDVSVVEGPSGALDAVVLTEPHQLQVLSFDPNGEQLLSEDLSSMLGWEDVVLDTAAGGDCLAVHLRLREGDEGFRFLLRQNGVWREESYDWGKNFVHSSDMAVGEDCSIHFFASNNHERLFHASNESGAWVVKRVANDVQFVRGTLTSDGEPVALLSLHPTRIARRAGGEWNLETVSTQPIPVGDLLIDENDRLWIVGSSTRDPGPIVVLRETTDGWADDSLNAEGGLAYYLGAYQRPGGPLHVLRHVDGWSWGDLSDDVLSDGVWTDHEILDRSFGSQSAGLWIDENGKRHLFYLALWDVVHQRVDEGT